MRLKLCLVVACFVACFTVSCAFEEAEFGKNVSNVCIHIWDYVTIKFNNKNCWYNPDVGANVENIVKRRGFPFETYEFVTDDGYINTIYRIPHNNTNQDKKRQPVLLQHGFGASSISFMVIGNRSLPFFLSSQGFDVWLGNPRGTSASKGHVKYTRSDPEFWDFSYHEIGIYDVKAEVEFIANNTNGGKIIYIGHSMGATESFIYAILHKNHARQHLSGIISLVPVAYMENFGGMYKKLHPFSNLLLAIMKRLHIHVIFDDYLETPVKPHKLFCSSYIGMIICNYLTMFFVGFDLAQINAEDLPVLYSLSSMSPASVSTKTLSHFSQQIAAGEKFTYYDYGPAKNLLLYNSTTPPAYNVSEIEVPVHIFYGEADYMADSEDVWLLFNKLKTKNKSITRISLDDKVRFNHMDFVAAKDVQELFYKPLLKTINENLRDDS